MVKPEQKQSYKLWWEYLKRSLRYKQYLKWEAKVDRRNRSKNQIPPLPKRLQGYHQPLWNMARTFGDVHSQSFEDWWRDELNINLGSTVFPYYSDPGKHIADGEMVVGKEIYKIYSRFRKTFKRDPTRDELIEGLRHHMTYWSKQRLYIVVEFLAEPPGKIVKEFKVLLKERIKETDAKISRMEIRGIEGKPTKGKLRKEPQQYLAVFDLSNQGLTMLEIVKRIGTTKQKSAIKAMNPLTAEEELEILNEKGNDIANIIRMYWRYLQKAKNIIENVEQGYFPGRYDTDDETKGTDSKRVSQ